MTTQSGLTALRLNLFKLFAPGTLPNPLPWVSMEDQAYEFSAKSSPVARCSQYMGGGCERMHEGLPEVSICSRPSRY